MSWLDPGAGILGAVLQGKPKLPDFQRLSPQQEQASAIQGNINELPQLESLASNINTFNTQQLEQMLRTAMPWFDSIRSQVGGVLSSEIAGQVPGDVSGVVQNSAAARALGGGFAGGGMQRNLFARDLGLTSLQLQQTGMAGAQSWFTTMDNIFKQGRFDISSMFVTPQQQMSFDVEERNAQFQHDWAKNILDWQSSLGYIVGGEMIKDSDAIAKMASDIIGNVGGKALGGMI